MEKKIRNTLIVGISVCSPDLIQQLKEESQKYSSSIIFFDPSQIDCDRFVNSKISSNPHNGTGIESVHSNCKLPLVFNVDSEQQLASVYIQENECQDRSFSLNFHDNLHANHLIWSCIQKTLLKQKVDSIVFLRQPQSLNEAILYQVARALNLETYLLLETVFENRFFSLGKLEDCGEFSDIEFSSDCPQYADDKIIFLEDSTQSKIVCTGFTFANVKKILLFLLKIKSFRVLDPIYVFKRAIHLHDAPIEINNWCDPFAKFFCRSRTSYFEFLSIDYSKEFILNSQFIYFHLQSRSELISEFLINRYADQVLAIEQLARIIPKGCKIVIKDESNDGADYLTPMFFHRVNRISPVVRVPNCVGSDLLIENCEFFATINSDLGWKSLNMGKRILLFGHPWYRKLPGVLQFEENLQYKNIMNFEPDFSELNYQLSKLLSKAHNGTLTNRIDQNFNEKNFSEDENANLVAQTIFNLIFGRTDTTFLSSEIN